MSCDVDFRLFEIRIRVIRRDASLQPFNQYALTAHEANGDTKDTNFEARSTRIARSELELEYKGIRD